MKTLLICLLSLVGMPISISAVLAEPPESELSTQTLEAFLKRHCIRCHGSEVQKADRRFDTVHKPAAGEDNGETLQEILDQLNLGSMPPGDEPQPSPSEALGMIDGLTEQLKQLQVSAGGSSGKVVLRRLNRAEYRNTVGDLFQLSMLDFDPTATFPADETTDGFDTVGEGLALSDRLLENYLHAARQVAAKAIRPGPRPKLYRESLRGEEIGGARQGFGGDAARLFIKFRQPLGLTRLDKRRGVEVDGEYVIRIRARAHQRQSRYSDEDLRYDSRQPMRLSISIDSRELGPTAHRVIGEYEIPDEEVVEIEHRLWLDRGFTFHLHWVNGPDGSFKRIMRKVLPKYNDEAIYPLRNPPEMYIGSGPELHVYSIEFEGPFYREWPPVGFAQYFPDPPENPDADYLVRCLSRLADRAWRRPVTTEELEPHLSLARGHLDAHGDFWEAARFGVRSILTSPYFLYLAESHDSDSAGANEAKVSDHELAARLSYFLWSSMPDEELRAISDQGRLRKPGMLRQQVDRMLSDERANALAENFAEQWLGLRELGQMPPDPEQNKNYYRDNLEQAMLTETRMFFGHVLEGNRSVLEFVDSNYTFANAALARHYSLPIPSFDEFRKVPLVPSDRRGGLLGQGSILTATSNGVETQPVRRGVWILENLLGTPPNAPPPDVDPIEPDTRGVSTMRELMEKHRRDPTCFECHRKIDPLGLSMEHFDHVGVWRDRYTKQLPIDAAGQLPDGTVVESVDDIRSYLLNRPEKFTRCLAEKLLVYGLGRRLTLADRVELDGIVKQMPESDYGFRELIRRIVESEAFQSK